MAGLSTNNIQCHPGSSTNPPTTTASQPATTHNTSTFATTTPPQLPDEILNAIFSNLVIVANNHYEYYETDEDTLRLKTLCSICLSSKHFHCLARPLLFRVLNFHTSSVIHDEDKQTSRFLNPDPKPILRAFCKDPSLGRGVRGIRLGYFAPPGFHEPETRPTDELAQLYRIALDRFVALPDNLRVRLADGLMQGSRDAELAMVIAMAPKVRWVDYVAVNNFETSLIAAVVTAAAAGLHHHQHQQPNDSASGIPSDDSFPTTPLQELQRLSTYHSAADDGGTRISEVESFLKLPSLRYMCLVRAICDDTFVAPSTTLSLRCIHFSESYVTITGLKTLLQASPHLTDLIITLADINSEERFVSGDEPSFTEFEEMLLQYGTRFQKVYFVDYRNSHFLNHPMPPVRSLSTLTRLEVLILQTDALFANSQAGDGESLELNDRYGLKRKLPRFLKFLRLLRSTQSQQDPDPMLIDQQLLEVMRAESSFPNLQRIEIDRKSPKVEDHDMTGIPFRAFETVLKNEYYDDQLCQVFEKKGPTQEAKCWTGPPCCFPMEMGRGPTWVRKNAE